MTDDERKKDQTDESGAGRRERLLRALGRPIVGVVLGIVIGAVCSRLPSAYQAPCEVMSRVIPQACGTGDKSNE